MRIIIIFALIFSLSQAVWAKAQEQIEKVNESKKFTSKFELKLNKNETKEEPKVIYSSEMTNYQYDDANYRYHQFEKYIKDNINYSQSGKIKY